MAFQNWSHVRSPNFYKKNLSFATVYGKYFLWSPKGIGGQKTHVIICTAVQFLYLPSFFVVLPVFSNWRNFASSSLLSRLARFHLPSSILSGNFKCAARNNNYRPLVGPQRQTHTHTHTHFHYRTRLLVRGTFHGIMFAHHKNTWDLSSSTAGLLCSAGSGSSSNSSPSSSRESSSFELNICVWGYIHVCVRCYPWQTMTLAICINPLWCGLPLQVHVLGCTVGLVANSFACYTLLLKWPGCCTFPA